MEIDNLAMSNCKIDHTYSFNLTITNSVLFSTMIRLSNDKQNKFIPATMQYYLNIEGTNFEQVSLYYGNCVLGTVSRSRFVGDYSNLFIIQIKVDDEEEDSESGEFEREATLLSSLRHPNILTFYGICAPNPNQKFMVVEYMKGGSLEKLISNCRNGKDSLDFQSKINILLGVARGMVYLHSLKPRMIVHRDLKPGNILLDENGAVRVCDFGLSRVVGTNTVQQRTMTTNIGTLLYCAPENFSSDSSSYETMSNYSQSTGSLLSSFNQRTSCSISNNDFFGSSSPSSYLSKEDRFKNASKIDVYSFAVIMYSLFFEESPFSNAKKLQHFSENANTEEANTHTLNILSFVLRGSRPKIPFDSPEQMKEWVSEYVCNKEKSADVMSDSLMNAISKYMDLMKQCWHQLPRERPSFDTIVVELYEIQSMLSVKQ
ncbi:hypothetical protein C9374_008101 [Naegleria lovaniensis]|uniref:non-specific serine/threonine protein kinase n=1 Tax=Naegleria lovaniensis TaxID=51637 RepID=A0AA88KFM8_NAELO|nr:uncharacterized protein C9374_008101 [Naegleria lovaniensis]KAG2378462.1 hypothetical protein C9374_008101 [Naegleria lovaniensis]